MDNLKIGLSFLKVSSVSIPYTLCLVAEVKLFFLHDSSFASTLTLL